MDPGESLERAEADYDLAQFTQMQKAKEQELIALSHLKVKKLESVLAQKQALLKNMEGQVEDSQKREFEAKAFSEQQQAKIEEYQSKFGQLKLLFGKKESRISELTSENTEAQKTIDDVETRMKNMEKTT